MICNRSQDGRGFINPNSLIFFGIAPGNLRRTVRAAVIDNYTFPIWISLSKNAFDAFRKMQFFVIDGGNDADQWLGLSFQVHLAYCSYDVPGAIDVVTPMEALLRVCGFFEQRTIWRKCCDPNRAYSCLARGCLRPTQSVARSRRKTGSLG